MEQPKISYTVKELAVRIGFHEQTIYRWLNYRGMPAHRACENGRFTIIWDEFIQWWKKDKNDDEWIRP